MPVLTTQQRKALEDACIKGRRASEEAVRAALTSLAITAERPPAHLDEDERRLRRGLRAKARQVGDQGDNLDLLVDECAYEQWHRLLFARFLSENNLLIHPEYRAPVSLEDCDELAEALGEPDGWSVAARFAAAILPGIFPLDDPCVRLRLAPEGRLALEAILADLPVEVFAAADALGWVYQYWQKDKKDEVNASEKKIGGSDLGPVTQLFTENYMVRFLLENTLGAWWASHHPDSPLVKGFEYLRFTTDGAPSSGSFSSWPSAVSGVTVMDPCCGSGHFLVEAFTMLWQMRAEEEGLTPSEAQDAVLRDNLFGLELDPRCVQIAAFAVAFAAWRAGGYRELPAPSIACSGISTRGQLSDWSALAGVDDSSREALAALHAQFRDAPTLGSLIDPGRPTPDGQLFTYDLSAFGPALERALASEDDPQARVAGVAAAGTARAAGLLSRRYTLVATNVPYLGIQRMPERMAEFLLARYPNSANDLATVFIERCLSLSSGTVAVVSPMGWLFLRYFSDLRRALLGGYRWDVMAPLGKGAFAGISGHVVQSALLALSRGAPNGQPLALDVTSFSTASEKAVALRSEPTVEVSQRALLDSPDTILALDPNDHKPLSDRATSWQGLVTSDVARFIVRFWEVPAVGGPWVPFLTAPSVTAPYSGRECLLRWESGLGDLVRNSGAHNFNPKEVLGKRGVLVGQGSLRVTLYTGEMFNDASSPVIPYAETDLPALWAYMSSSAYAEQVRRINHKVIVGSGYLVKVPFDLDQWQEAADLAGPIPDPRSADPTQWLFEGRPEGSSAPLQVAAARLLGYRWPDQPDSDDLDGFADADGIVCLPSVAGEPPAVDRLQQLLAVAFGSLWSPAKQKELLEETGSKKKSVADWLRDDFFKQHCAQFGHRPFIWHIWDGQRDGFAALVNYHRLDRKMLEKLTYTYLGDWIERQRAETRDEKAGAEARLAAASTLRGALELILDGEPPYDIYARWKSPAEQPIGWEPDVNDGVRVNVRPFVEAGVLRSSFNIHWRKDRGKNMDGTERLNDLHITTAEKRAVRRGSA